MSKPPRANTSGKQTRRHFLKDTATITAGAALGTLALSRSAHAAGDGTIKIGMIGSGGRCAGAATESMAASEDVKLVAMCDVFESRVRSMRESLRKGAHARRCWSMMTIASRAWTAIRR